MSGGKNRFNLSKNDSKPKVFSKLKGFRHNQIKSGSDDNKKMDYDKDSDAGQDNGKVNNREFSSFASFDSIIPESSPLRMNSNSDSGFYNDELKSKPNHRNSPPNNDWDGVDEKYAKYIFLGNPNDQRALNDFKDFDEDSDNPFGGCDYDSDYDSDYEADFGSDNGMNIKDELLNFKKRLLNKNNSSKNLFGKITFILIFLVLISSMFYFFVYQPFQNELNLERNSKLNELNALYNGPLQLNENYYTLENQINQAYDLEELRSIDVMRYATKDWRLYHSSKIVSCKDDFGRVMMSYGDNKNIIMSVKDANDFVRDNDAKILSNVQFEKVNTVIVPISISRLQATAGLISVGSVVDIYSLNDNSSEYEYGIESNEGDMESSHSDLLNDGSNNAESNINQNNENLSQSIPSNETIGGDVFDHANKSLERNEGPLVSGATVLAILRSKDSGLVDSAVSRSNTIIKGNETNPFENTSTYSSDVEELLKAAVLNSNSNDNALDSYLTNYGVRLSNFERMSNLGDLDSNYLILLEVPQSDVNFVINNMDNLILTIPTDFAPNWVLTELNQTYYENLYQNQSIGFL